MEAPLNSLLLPLITLYAAREQRPDRQTDTIMRFALVLHY